MVVDETPSISSLQMDRGLPLGNSQDVQGRRALHVKNLNALVTLPYDAGTVTYPDPVTEVYAFRLGGVGGVIQQTVTLVYTDSTKADLSSFAVV